jgi:hypothetical protein
LTKFPKTYNGEKATSSINVAGKLVICLIKWKLDPCLSPCTNINSKCIKDLNIRPETLKLVQKRARNTLEATGIGKHFLNRTRVSATKRKD